MAISFIGKTTYSGETPSVTLSGAAGIQNKVAVVLGFTESGPAIASNIYIDGTPIEIVGTKVVDLGQEASVALAYLEHPGAGTYTFSYDIEGGGFKAGAAELWQIFEFADAGIPYGFVSSTLNGITTADYSLSVTGQNELGDVAVTTTLQGEGWRADGTTTGTYTPAYSSFSINVNSNKEAGLLGGYRVTTAANETTTVDVTNVATPGGNVDRVTMATMAIGDYVSIPTVTLTNPPQLGAVLSGTGSNYAAQPTGPISITQGARSLPDMPITVSAWDAGAGSFNWTTNAALPGLPANGADTTPFVLTGEDVTITLPDPGA